LGGLKGGTRRAKALTPQQRFEIARLSAEARWKKRAPLGGLIVISEIHRHYDGLVLLNSPYSNAQRQMKAERRRPPSVPDVCTNDLVNSARLNK
jgi:hypothetical protein